MLWIIPAPWKIGGDLWRKDLRLSASNGDRRNYFTYAPTTKGDGWRERRAWSLEGNLEESCWCMTWVGWFLVLERQILYWYDCIHAYSRVIYARKDRIICQAARTLAGNKPATIFHCAHLSPTFHIRALHLHHEKYTPRNASHINQLLIFCHSANWKWKCSWNPK